MWDGVKCWVPVRIFKNKTTLFMIGEQNYPWKSS